MTYTWKNLIAGNKEFILGISESVDIQKCKFLPMIAFVGSSNVGKSTLINQVVNSQKLSRTSKFPGHTRQINIFNLDSKILLADLPGYGYAKRSKSEVLRLANLILTFIELANNLCLVNLLIDIRRGLRANDIQIIEHLSINKRQMQVILTKSDCVDLHTQNSERDKIAGNIFNLFGMKVNVMPVSSKFGTGIKELANSMLSFFMAYA
jgi:GTP-binding protein